MPPSKRKRAQSVPSEESDSDESSPRIAQSNSDDDEMDFDISSALTGRKPRRDGSKPASTVDDDEEDDDDLAMFLKDTIAKRDVKEGTQVIKKAKKGKGKVAKGEVGGGSFQSMGAFQWYFSLARRSNIYPQAFTRHFSAL